ncbi:MAG TPA: DUF6502 family protein [Ramlibacter sp.]|nr:DUF6502 family protein [Ramlibacter sp.]
MLHLFKPLARLLLRHGVAYPAFSAALKQVFVDAALDELQQAGRKQTDSAVSLLSGVHRRDVRTLGRAVLARALAEGEPMNMASQVVARWLAEPGYLDEDGRPLGLTRAGPAPSFDALVESISRDVRPRAVLDDMVRLGLAQEAEGEVRLLQAGFAPRQGFQEMAALMQDNLHDHIAAASLNLDGGHNFLEQAVFVEELSAASAHEVHRAAARAWRQAFRSVMKEAQARYDHDQAHTPPHERAHRVRFGSYFYAEENHDHTP